MQQQNYNQQMPPYGQQPYGQQNYGGGYQVDLPNATGVLVLGILSIIFAGLIGVVLSIIALNMASTAKAEYDMNPGRYTEASMSRVRAGRVCAIVGLCLLAFVILLLVVVLAAGNM
ncbi:MAG: hypothetical protein FD123_2299 [Bacteroidetes bacterium]|nr:MAG: hypothetical protein FD123_2299 [Bacteroidota bacterium]